MLLCKIGHNDYHAASVSASAHHCCMAAVVMTCYQLHS